MFKEKKSQIKNVGHKKQNKSQIEELKQTIKEKNERIDSLEKEYLSKIAKLLVMTQIHCEIKTEIYDDFHKCGVGKNVKEIDPEQSFNNNNDNNMNSQVYN